MKLIPQDTSSRDAYLSALFLNLALITFILIILPRISPIIPLFYSRPWGEEQLASRLTIFLAPAVSIAFLIINHVLARYFAPDWFSRDAKNRKENNLLVLRILSFSALTVSLLSCITILRIALITS